MMASIQQVYDAPCQCPVADFAVLGGPKIRELICDRIRRGSLIAGGGTLQLGRDAIAQLRRLENERLIAPTEHPTRKLGRAGDFHRQLDSARDRSDLLRRMPLAAPDEPRNLFIEEDAHHLARAAKQ